MPDEPTGPEPGELTEDGEKAMLHFEGDVPHVYVDVAGYETIGKGHKLTEEERRTGVFAGGSVVATKDARGRWTIQPGESNTIFRWDMRRFVSGPLGVNTLVTVPLDDGKPNGPQRDALLLWYFNTGGLPGSTLLHELNAGHYAAVPLEMVKWCHRRDPKTGLKVEDSGLFARRRAEAAVWVNGYVHKATETAFADAAAIAAAHRFNLQETLESGHVSLRDEDGTAPDTPRNT